MVQTHADLSCGSWTGTSETLFKSLEVLRLKRSTGGWEQHVLKCRLVYSLQENKDVAEEQRKKAQPLYRQHLTPAINNNLTEDLE